MTKKRIRFERMDYPRLLRVLGIVLAIVTNRPLWQRFYMLLVYRLDACYPTRRVCNLSHSQDTQKMFVVGDLNTVLSSIGSIAQGGQL